MSLHLPYIRVCRHIVALCLASVLVAGCDGIFDGIYDSPVADADLHPGFNDSGRPARFTILVDARDYDRWVYLDLHRRTMETRPVPASLTGRWDGESRWVRYHVTGARYERLEDRAVDTQAEPETWDLAIHHFDVRTHGGAALRTDYATVDDVPLGADVADMEFVADGWTTHQCITDLSGMFDRNIWYQASMVNPVLTEWVKMDFSTPPPKYEASRRVYLLRMADGTLAALQLKSYMSEAGTKGFLTIDVRYPLVLSGDKTCTDDDGEEGM